MASVKVDPSSAATAGYKVTHMDIVWQADFDTKQLSGTVTHSIERCVDGATQIVLDSKVGSIEAITLKADGSSLDFKLEKRTLTTAVTVELPSSPADAEIIIKYSTSADASGIQWLSPSQTSGKTHPFLFTQCQAIHARSVVPCQDTPEYKCTYTAAVTVPKELTALMSAESTSNDKHDKTVTYHFKQEVAIPTYLLALVVGKLESRELGPRCRVWSEAEQIEASAKEFEDVETMLTAAENLLGPYVWKRYDLLVLPASFPYGGMENPMLTFVTPTLLAGDKSLTNVVIHEITHSWTGNLVTSATWEHFWLNEGFTVYAERKIVGALHGEQARQFACIGGLKSLRDSVDVFGEGNPLTALCPRIDENTDPDDAFSSVPYEKGSNLLYYLETKLGSDAMDDFLKLYIKEFSHKSITTADFKEFLYSHFVNKQSVLDEVDWEAWFHTPGMPIVTNTFDDTLGKAAVAMADQILAGGMSDKDWSDAADAVQNFTSTQVCAMLDTMLTKKSATIDLLSVMDKAFALGARQNSEIKFRWLRLCLQANWKEQYPQVADFVTAQGRMKFVRPLYRELSKAEGGAQLAKETFLKHRDFYHNIASTMVARDLGV
eukprot:TRINITY_DN6608_c0_g1_i1.p1 TRINITY_DN6608_c0_g1~~TRINITY_DN6608_c0_g1_i1.p1  ORF type:complete len:624 (+),score=155.98 TRINITY_DN6608_c0_g1_i1:60-1874(+)